SASVYEISCGHGARFANRRVFAARERHLRTLEHAAERAPVVHHAARRARKLALLGSRLLLAEHVGEDSGAGLADASIVLAGRDHDASFAAAERTDAVVERELSLHLSTSCHTCAARIMMRIAALLTTLAAMTRSAPARADAWSPTVDGLRARLVVTPT